MDNFRILHIIDSIERGGAETLVVNAINTLQQKYPNSKQYLVTLYKGESLLSNISDDIKYYNLEFRLTNIISVIYRLNELIKKFNIDVVHSHLLHSTFITRLSLPSKTKLFTTYHSVYYDPDLVDYARKELVIDKLTYKSKYYSIFVSEAVRQNITKAVGIKNNCFVLVNFASPKFKYEYKVRKDDGLKIIMVGNLKAVKNHELAIRALAQLQEQPITLDIFGEGELKPYLKNLINELGANVILRGAAAMSSSILSEYDIFMMTSHHEGMPVSLLEAMQTGLPSILNDLPTLRETAADSAIYFDYNSEESLVKALTSLMLSKKILTDLSSKALKRAANFSVDNYITSLIEIYSL